MVLTSVCNRHKFHVVVLTLNISLCICAVANGHCGLTDTEAESSHSPSLSTSSHLASTSPVDACKLTVTTTRDDASSAELPAVTMATASLVTVTTASMVTEEPFKFEITSQSTNDDLFYDKKDAQDIVSALQGTFNFLQDSEIDEDSKQRRVLC